MTTFSPPLAPSPSSSKEIAYRVRRADFGGGQVQVAADGVNNVVVSYSLVWQSLTNAQASAIEDFFNARYGVESFLYTFPGDIQRRFRAVSSVTRAWASSGVLSDVSVKIEEVFP